MYLLFAALPPIIQLLQYIYNLGSRLSAKRRIHRAATKSVVAISQQMQKPGKYLESFCLSEGKW